MVAIEIKSDQTGHDECVTMTTNVNGVRVSVEAYAVGRLIDHQKLIKGFRELVEAMS